MTRVGACYMVNFDKSRGFSVHPFFVLSVLYSVQYINCESTLQNILCILNVLLFCFLLYGLQQVSRYILYVFTCPFSGYFCMPHTLVYIDSFSASCFNDVYVFCNVFISWMLLPGFSCVYYTGWPWSVV